MVLVDDEILLESELDSDFEVSVIDDEVDDEINNENLDMDDEIDSSQVVHSPSGITFSQTLLSAVITFLIHKFVDGKGDQVEQVDLSDILNRLDNLDKETNRLAHGLIDVKQDFDNWLNGGSAQGNQNLFINGEPNPAYKVSKLQCLGLRSNDNSDNSLPIQFQMVTMHKENTLSDRLVITPPYNRWFGAGSINENDLKSYTNKLTGTVALSSAVTDISEYVNNIRDGSGITMLERNVKVHTTLSGMLLIFGCLTDDRNWNNWVITTDGAYYVLPLDGNSGRIGWLGDGNLSFSGYFFNRSHKVFLRSENIQPQYHLGTSEQSVGYKYLKIQPTKLILQNLKEPNTFVVFKIEGKVDKVYFFKDI